MSEKGRLNMHRLDTLSFPLLVTAALALTAVTCLGGQSAERLPACEWCGTAEAPDNLRWTTTIAPASEPGERLVVRGVVYESDGRTPASDVILYIYHTNAEGIYPKRGDETGNGRRHGYLRGWLRTDDRGRYEIRTIRPASYPSATESAHIHVTVQQPDATPEYWLDSFLFADDPRLPAEARGPHVLELRRGGGGVLYGERDITLPAMATTAPTGSTLCVDTNRSLIRWRGTKAGGGSHEGIVRLAGGQLRMEGAAVTGGAFQVDMRSIAVTDMPPHEVEARRQLRSHLAHGEFFDVDRFPTAGLVLTRVEGGKDGVHSVSGDLTIRDSVHNVTFEATAPVLTTTEVLATARFSIDRQRWGVTFDGRTSRLRNALVHDPIHLDLTLVASAQGRGCDGPEQ